jgi:hypothetical protein
MDDEIRETMGLIILRTNTLPHTEKEVKTRN